MTKVRDLEKQVADLRAALETARPYVAAACHRAPAPYGKGIAADLAKVDAALK